MLCVRCRHRGRWLTHSYGDFSSEICDRLGSSGARRVEETTSGGQDQSADMCGVWANTGWSGRGPLLFELRAASATPSTADLGAAPLLLGRLRVRGRRLAAGVQRQPHHLLPQLLHSGNPGTIRALGRRDENRHRNENASPGVRLPGWRYNDFVRRAFHSCRKRSGVPSDRRSRICSALLHLHGVLGRICIGSEHSSRGAAPVWPIH